MFDRDSQSTSRCSLVGDKIGGGNGAKFSEEDVFFIVYLESIAGLLLLIVGSRMLIRGASELAEWALVSSVVIGLTVVAYGTSSPELVVSVTSSWGGQNSLALGNVMGSNIFNILFILGICASLFPLIVHQNLLFREVPILIGLTIVSLLFCLNEIISPLEGSILLSFLGIYTFWTVVESRNTSRIVREEYQREFSGTSVNPSWLRLSISFVLVLVGLGCLTAGSYLFTNSASYIARAWGLSELVIGLTIVSAGTSMPEVITSLLATWDGETDIAVGNVIGSNIFNLAGVLGLSSVVSGNGIPLTPTILLFDFPILVVVTVLCLLIFFSQRRITRWEGILFLVLFIAYTTGRVMIG